MHIPDGMLSTPVFALSWAGAIGFMGYAVREVRRRIDEKKLVLMAVLAALIFALQMLNFPVAGGTSGHFAGGAAAAIILGPWPAVLVMSAVLAVQALLFADGGITALGANIINLAVVGPFVGWATYTLLTRVRDSKSFKVGSSFVAAWLAVELAAVSAAVMVWASGAAPFGIVVGSMAFWHALIGIGEGLITAGLIGYLLAVRPDLLGASQERAHVRNAAIGLAVLALLAVGVSFLASSYPDGLEFVAERAGFLNETEPVFGGSLIPDYAVPGVANETLAGVLAGLAGIVVTGVLVYGAVAAVRARSSRAE
jgi:cobalt/nickel transport system permease protein